jgi:hypothetical protein
MFSKKFVTSFLRDAVNARPVSLVRLFETPLTEVKVHEMSPYETYSVININPYTLEEQLMLYPIVVVHKTPGYPAPTVIDIE